ncbi:MAG: RNA polymerase factor sigma-54 [Methylophilaceae bacterium]|nr:RNA polymerase factor sigma-54 [Methylophilaceae bacterium]
MKQSLNLKFSQNLALTPQLQQSIRLLQLSTQELNQELETILQENPLLELVETNADGSLVEPGFDGDDHLPNLVNPEATQNKEFGEESITNSDIGADSDSDFSTDFTAEISSPTNDGASDSEISLADEHYSQSDFSDDYEEYGSNTRWDEGAPNNHFDDDDNDFSKQETVSISLREHLISQIKLMPLSERDQTLAILLVDSIDENGYLEQPLEILLDVIPEELEVELLELQTTLKLVQHLDPLGIGATDLSECLSLQLNVMPQATPYLELAKRMVSSHLALLASRDFVKLRKLLNSDDTALRGAQVLIKQLNPRPGNSYSAISSDHYIQHEVIVKKVKGIWIATLNDGVIPKLRINQLYSDILKRNRDSSNQYLMSQMQEAKWMIKNIQQRFSTILRVSQAIIDRQRNFFEHGEIAMRPLVLREIADELELHESTISRVTTHKYMLTPRGVFELKYFFGSHVSTDSGGECSATAIRALIKQMVVEENSQKPLSDNQITDVLAKQGIVVARRTIAKYRESLSIPPANLRKSL